MSWRLEAACAGGGPHGLPVHAWFDGVGATAAERAATRAAAVATCHGCPVATECLLDALRAGEDYGIRGGVDLTAETRRRELATERARRTEDGRRAA